VAALVPMSNSHVSGQFVADPLERASHFRIRRQNFMRKGYQLCKETGCEAVMIFADVESKSVFSWSSPGFASWAEDDVVRQALLARVARSSEANDVSMEHSVGKPSRPAPSKASPSMRTAKREIIDLTGVSYNEPVNTESNGVALSPGDRDETVADSAPVPEEPVLQPLEDVKLGLTGGSSSNAVDDPTATISSSVLPLEADASSPRPPSPPTGRNGRAKRRRR